MKQTSRVTGMPILTEEEIEKRNRLSRTLYLIKAERWRQQAKWGKQEHQFPMWLCILMKELGDVAKAHLDFTRNPPTRERQKAVEDELVQVAAVAAAMLECWVYGKA